MRIVTGKHHNTLPDDPTDHLAVNDGTQEFPLENWLETDSDSNETRRLFGAKDPTFEQAFDAGQDIERARQLAYELREKLDKLDKSINALPRPIVRAGRVRPVKLSTEDYPRQPSMRARGATTPSNEAALRLQNLRQFPEIACSIGTRNVLDARLPDIQKDLKELDTILRKRQHRWAISARLLTIIAMRYEHCDAMEQAIKGAEKALRAAIVTAGKFENAMVVPAATTSAPQQVIPLRALHNDDPTRSVVLTQLAQTRDALYKLIASLIQRFNMLSERVFLTPRARDAIAHAKAEKHAEEAFKETHKDMLRDLRCSKNSPLVESIHASAFQSLQNSGISTRAMDIALQTDIEIGQNITGAILASGPNFGAVKYTATAGAGTTKCEHIVPSNLTTVRAIARYIAAQAIVNVLNPPAAVTAPALSQGEDGSYTIADPQRQLYSFLASAPTAHANFSAAVSKGASTNLLMDRGIGRMTIADYSGTLPGGANQMEFEAQIDKHGANVLTVRFLKQADESMLRPEQAVGLDSIRKLRLKLWKERLGIAVDKTPAETPDFTGMSISEVETYLDNMRLAFDGQNKLLEEDTRLYEILNKWENRTFE